MPLGAARPEHVEHAVQQGAHRPVARPAATRRSGQERLCDLPLGIGQVGCVGLGRARKLGPGGGGLHRQPRRTSDIPRTLRIAAAYPINGLPVPVPKQALRPADTTHITLANSPPISLQLPVPAVLAKRSRSKLSSRFNVPFDSNPAQHRRAARSPPWSPQWYPQA